MKPFVTTLKSAAFFYPKCPVRSNVHRLFARADWGKAAAAAQERSPIGHSRKGTHKVSLALAQACMAANKAGHKGAMQRAIFDFVSLGHIPFCT